MNENEEKKILVERETYEYKGKTYFSYYVKGTVRGREVKAQIVPPDRGGFVVLDILFDASLSVELALNPYEFEDEKTHKVISGTAYSVKSVDENGEIYECPVQPARRSDKSMLDMLIKANA